MFDSEMIKVIIQEGEGLTVEFKEHFTPRIAEDMAAFANTKGGLIILGVKDDKTVIGEKLSNNLKAQINSIARNCSPPISVKIRQLQNIVSIEVPRGEEKPYSCGSGYYRRLDGTTQKMTNHELRTMFRENDAIPFEEQTVKDFSFKDISKKKIQAFVKNAGIKIGSITNADFLRSLKVADNSTVKNAGILFFAGDPHRYLHQSQMTLLGFKGTKKIHIYDRSDVQDDLLTQFNEAIAFLKKHLNIRSVIRGTEREDIYEIPFDAIREAVVNALMHRDYSITGSQISIEVYDDRIEIISPGGLPPGLTKKSFGKTSIRRNERISDMFFRLHMVERVGMGIHRMRESAMSAGLREPAFESDDFFRTILYRPEDKFPEGRKASDVGSTTQKTTQKTARLILELIALNPHTTRKELADRIGISADGVKYHLNNMRKQNLIRRIGSDRSGRWEIVGG